MKLNGKNFKITAGVELGLVDEIEQGNLSKELMVEFCRQALQPIPSDEDLSHLTFEQYFDIFLGFKKALERKISQVKKKLSQ